MIIIWFDSIRLNFKTKTTYKVGWSCECVGFSTSSLAVAENCRWKSIDSHLDQSGNRNGDHKDSSEHYLDNIGVMPVLQEQKFFVKNPWIPDVISWCSISWFWRRQCYTKYDEDDNNRMALGRSQSNSDILNTAVNDNRGTAHMLSYDEDHFHVDENKDDYNNYWVKYC